MVKAFSPQDLDDNPEVRFPDFVIEAFNNVIQRNYRNGWSKFVISEVAAEIRKLSPTPLQDRTISKNGWFDIEPLYRKQGWKVEYDSPGFNESYEGNYTFRK
jgi:hypothetical protein